MLDNGDLGLFCVFCGDGAALQAGAGVFDRIEITRHSEAACEDADAESGFVHHVEHGGQTFSWFADEFTDARVVFAEVECGVDGGAVAHFVVQPDEADAITGASGSIGVDVVAGDNKKRNTSSGLGCAVDAGQYEVDDIFGQVVFAARDPHFAAAQVVGAVGLRRGAGAKISE